MSASAIEIENGTNGYVDLVRHVLTYGEEVAPRGMKTREIEDAVIFIEDVYNTLPLKVGRGSVPGIGAVEACQILAGESYNDLIVAVGPQFRNYAESDGIFHGAYGPRTREQYPLALDKLRNDNDTRQAVITLWNPNLDNQPNKRDYPCTILHQFRIRDNKLNMSVYMRSNDVWLGAAYDFFQFTRVQIAMASVLGIEPGKYAHHVGSLHIYEQHYDAAENLKKTDEIMPIPTITGSTWDDVRASAKAALDAASGTISVDGLDADSRWYADAMITAIEKNKAKGL